MTDKQEIIINGVDVSEYTLKEIEYKLSHTTKNKIIESCLEIVKQLQRKTAELKKYQDMEKEWLEQFKDVGGCWGCGLELTNQ